MQKTIQLAEYSITLNAEPNNPARFLSEKVRFSSNYIGTGLIKEGYAYSYN